MLEPPLLECKCITWRWLNVNTGEVRPFSCGSWSCPDHRAGVAWRWASRVAWARPERMITLTAVPRAREEAYRAFYQLVRDVRARGEFQYIRFLEAGKDTGMLHYHLAQKGDYIPQAWLSERARANGLGRVVDIRVCKGQGPAFYLAKYITKEAAPRGWRKVAYSKGWPRPPAPPGEEGWVLQKGTGSGIPDAQ